MIINLIINYYYKYKKSPVLLRILTGFYTIHQSLSPEFITIKPNRAINFLEGNPLEISARLLRIYFVKIF